MPISNTILDFAAKIGVQAQLERVPKTQLEGIIASLELIDDEKASLLVTAGFAHRQASKASRSRNCKINQQVLQQAFYKADSGRKKSIRGLIELAKWVYEAVKLDRSSLEWESGDLTFVRPLKLFKLRGVFQI